MKLGMIGAAAVAAMTVVCWGEEKAAASAPVDPKKVAVRVNDATLTRDEYQKKKAPKGKTPPGPSSPAAKGAKGKEKTK